MSGSVDLALSVLGLGTRGIEELVCVGFPLYDLNYYSYYLSFC